MQTESPGFVFGFGFGFFCQSFVFKEQLKIIEVMSETIKQDGPDATFGSGCL